MGIFYVLPSQILRKRSSRNLWISLPVAFCHITSYNIETGGCAVACRSLKTGPLKRALRPADEKRIVVRNDRLDPVSATGHPADAVPKSGLDLAVLDHFYFIQYFRISRTVNFHVLHWYFKYSCSRYAADPAGDPFLLIVQDGRIPC